MGTHYTSYSIVGIRIPYESLRGKSTQIEVSSCNHSQSKGQVFCPVCGIKVSVRSVYSYEFSGYKQCEAMQVAFGAGWIVTNQNEYWDNVLIGMGVSFDCDSPACFMALPDKSVVLARLQEVLSGMGLWNPEVEATFGLHGVMLGY